jgi:hypothetical protein
MSGLKYKFLITLLGLRFEFLVTLLSLRLMCQVKGLTKLKVCFFGFTILFGLQLFSKANACNNGNIGFV